MKLIAFSYEHFDSLAGWMQTEVDVVQWGGPSLRFPLSMDQFEAMLQEGMTTPPTRMCWMMQDSCGSLVGHVQLAFDWQNGTALLGRVVIAPNKRGGGLAGPMVAHAIDIAFDFPDIARVELNVFTWNTPAIRTYERLGFQKEGVRRQSVLVSGSRWDTAIVGLMRRERLLHE